MPKLSIITINLNNKFGLEKTIQSVVNQTFDDFEYIIIDGASTDGSLSVIKQYQDQIDYWVSEQDKGIYNAMNKGVKAANGTYICIVNSGDLLFSNYSLSLLDSYLINLDNKYLLFFLDCLIVRPNSTRHIFFPADIQYYSDLLNNFFCHSSTIYHKSIFNKIGLFNERHCIVSDYGFYMKALVQFNLPFKRIPFCFSVFFADGISSLNSKLHHKEFQEVRDRHYKYWKVRLYSGRSFRRFKKSALFPLILLLNIDKKI